MRCKSMALSPSQYVNTLVQKWSTKHPELASRLERAMALTGSVHSQGEGTFVVEGATGDYIVGIEHGRSTCTCQDFKRGHHCKHRLACALVCMTERAAAQKGSLR